ncbi:MAG TPA: LLM class flavin-dependent oxidoreductase [Gaiellaceae bacterium]|nr:LLM class flavin-dependent oxidoreductase [Gaiellaceae bacterium]
MPDAAGIDLVVYGTEAPSGLLECVELAESAGLGGVWVGDSPVLWRELYVLLGAAAERTERVRLGPAVTNPVSRHVAVTASALLTLQELSGGRAALGLGLGASAVRTVGARPARLAELERTVAEVRALWAGGEGGLGYGGGERSIPLLLGASGPRMLELSARVGDGCLAVVGLHPRQLEAARARIAAGRPAGDFELVWWVPIAAGDDPARAREDVKPYVARSLRHPLPAELTPVELEAAERIRDSYEYGRHLEPGAHAELVPDEIVADWAVSGTPAECREQLRSLDLGRGERIGLVPMGAEPKAVQVRRLVEEVLWG